ncbi:hypothetical protein ABTM59_11445 [Acinetobacter baumannii]
MSEFKEFKVGDWIIDPLIGDKVIKCHDGYLREMKFFGSVMRHATPQEIAAGHRIESSNDQAISDCSVSNLCKNDTQNSLPIKQENQDMGDDFPIENHISPNCQSRDV